MTKYKVWSCKIVIAEDVELPNGFDSPPRHAAMNAIEKHGIKVISCFSGWGGKLTKMERVVLEEDRNGKIKRQLNEM